MRVEDIMHKGAASVSPSTAVSSIAKIMKADNLGAMPVVENGKVIGIVTDRDLVIQALADGIDPGAMTARQVMTGNAICYHMPTIPTKLCGSWRNIASVACPFWTDPIGSSEWSAWSTYPNECHRTSPQRS